MAEKEYIERGTIVKFIQEGLNNSDKSKAFGHDAIEILAEVFVMPVADVVEVVRCKDCAYWKEHNGMAEGMECCILFDYRFRPLLTGPEDFCSRGKRKDDDHEASDGN